MRITGTHNLFANNFTSAVNKPGASTAFADALASLINGRNAPKSAEAQRAADMAEAIEALDKALELAREEKLLSEAQVNWLSHRHDVSAMYVSADDAAVTSLRSGSTIMSEAHGRLLDDLYALGLLSDRDMEALNDRFMLTAIPVDPSVSSTLTRVEDLPFWERFFNSSLNPNWRSDIVGFHKAMVGRHLEAYEISVRVNPDSPMSNAWRESAEAHYRLANILAQIFG